MNYVQSIILENENIHIFSKLKKVLQLKCNKDKICIKLLAKKKLGTTHGQISKFRWVFYSDTK